MNKVVWCFHLQKQVNNFFLSRFCSKYTPGNISKTYVNCVFVNNVFIFMLTKHWLDRSQEHDYHDWVICFLQIRKTVHKTASRTPEPSFESHWLITHSIPLHQCSQFSETINAKLHYITDKKVKSAAYSAICAWVESAAPVLNVVTVVSPLHPWKSD